MKTKEKDKNISAENNPFYFSKSNFKLMYNQQNKMSKNIKQNVQKI